MSMNMKFECGSWVSSSRSFAREQLDAPTREERKIKKNAFYDGAHEKVFLFFFVFVFFVPHRAIWTRSFA